MGFGTRWKYWFSDNVKTFFFILLECSWNRVVYLFKGDKGRGVTKVN